MVKKVKKIGEKVIVDPKKHKYRVCEDTDAQVMDKLLLLYHSRSEFDFLCGHGGAFYSLAIQIFRFLQYGPESFPTADYVVSLLDGVSSNRLGESITRRMNDDALQLYLGGDVTGMRITRLADVKGVGIEAECHSKTDPHTRYLCSFVWMAGSDAENSNIFDIRHYRCECVFKKMNAQARLCSHIIAAFYSLAAAVGPTPLQRPQNARIKSLDRESAIAQMRAKYFWPLVVRGWTVEFILDRKPPIPQHPVPTIEQYLNYVESPMLPPTAACETETVPPSAAGIDSMAASLSQQTRKKRGGLSVVGRPKSAGNSATGATKKRNASSKSQIAIQQLTASVNK